MAPPSLGVGGVSQKMILGNMGEGGVKGKMTEWQFTQKYGVGGVGYSREGGKFKKCI